jgi:hypothetical protein
MERFQQLIDLQSRDSLMTPPASFAFVLLRLLATYVRTALSLPKSGILFVLGLSMFAPRLSLQDFAQH